jgi:hypothetical protein
MRALDRFQVSPWPIVALAKRPDRAEVALIESDGLGLYRVSAWNYLERRNLFKIRSQDPASAVTYSAAGSFIILSRNGRTGAVFIDSETGAPLVSPEVPAGLVSFAATGRSERSLILYLASGHLSYWNLENNRELRRFPVAPDLKSPLLFGNNRFFGGLDEGGLVLFDAATGRELLRDSRLSGPGGSLFPAPGEEAGFFCMAPGESGREFFYALMPAGVPSGDAPEGLELRSLFPAPEEAGAACAVPETAAGAVYLGTSGGLVYRARDMSPLVTGGQVPVTDAAALPRSLVFITGNGYTGTAARDYRAINEGETLALYPSPYRRVSPDAGGGERFIFWQEGGREPPLLKASPGDPGRPLRQRPAEFPLLGVSLLNDRALFLDSGGNANVVSAETGDTLFSFSAAGSLEAAFLDEGNIIFGRNSAAGGTPFLKVNILTGETVPLAYPAAVGFGLRTGAGGTLYAAAIGPGDSGFSTFIIALDAERPALSRRLAEYAGESSQLVFAESSGVIASTMGGDGALLHYRGRDRPFERSPGLPALILGGDLFITLDSEGNISWHSPFNGSLLALLRIRGDKRWELELRKEGRVITGPVEYHGGS